MISILNGIGFIFLGILFGISLSILGNTLYNKKIKKRVVERNLGCYDSRTGKFLWLNKDMEYIWNGLEITEETYLQEECQIFKIIPKTKSEIIDD